MSAPEEIVPPVLLDGVPHAVYHADPWGPSLSRSIAHRLVSHSPLHAWAAHPRLGNQAAGDDSSEAQERGTLLHTLLLGIGPELVVIEADDFRKKVAQEERDDALGAGHVPVLKRKYERGREAAATIEQRLTAEGVKLKECTRELTALWREGSTLCRARLDLYLAASATIYDLKFVRSANPAAFARSMPQHGIDIQAHVYPRAVGMVFPDLAGRVGMEYLLVEPEPPYAVARVRAAGSMRSLGESKWRRAVDLWERCLASGEWPGYGAAEVECLPWQLTEAMIADGFGSDPDWMNGGGGSSS